MLDKLYRLATIPLLMHTIGMVIITFVASIFMPVQSALAVAFGVYYGREQSQAQTAYAKSIGKTRTETWYYGWIPVNANEFKQFVKDLFLPFALTLLVSLVLV